MSDTNHAADDARADRIVWMDLEMSGLDPARDRILEVAVLVTDAELNVVAEGPQLVVHQPEEILAAMDPWCVRQHGQSGLTEQVRASRLGEAEAEARLLDFLQAHVPERACPLGGNSVHQDRAFLRRYMPRVEAWLHYRNVDVSTLKELVRRWYPEAYAARPPKDGVHRALGDIHESLAELRYYRRAVFR